MPRLNLTSGTNGNQFLCSILAFDHVEASRSSKPLTEEEVRVAITNLEEIDYRAM